MGRQILSAAAILMLTGVLATAATPITIENWSFELPGTTKQTNFTNVPGWSTDTVAGDSGVETGYTPTDGTWTAYLRGQTDDPSIWQLTDHVIVLGDVFELKVDSRLTWQATTLRMTIYYDNNGARTVGATADYTITGTMTEFSLTFDSSTLPNSAGHKVGVEFANPSGASTWLGLDRVRLDLTKEGATGLASAPSPDDGATGVALKTALSWTAGPEAGSHDVYFGTSRDDVSAASRTDTRNVLVSQGQTDTSFNPGQLQWGTTYYWRIDEVNAPPATGSYKGSIWSFTTEFFAYKVTGVTATASSATASNPPINAVNESGLSPNDEHSGTSSDMWLTATKAATPAWIQFDLGRVCKLYEMWVWNYNGQFEELLGFGLKDVTITYSADGVTWATLGQFQFAQGTGVAGYVHDITVPFGGQAVRYVKITVISAWSTRGQYGLSEVRFLEIPVMASNPSPAAAAPDVAADAVLSWKAGREATSHKIYMGTDPNALTLVGTTTTNSYAPVNMNLGVKYYWRVDEVNTAEALSTWAGAVWSFTTRPYIPVDDMESYTDVEPTRIFDVWIDGWGTTTNAAVVGNDPSPFAEETIIHGGAQSMPLAYNNSSTIPNAEATRTFDAVQDWTRNGVTTLTLYFRGLATNATTVPMWIKLTDQAGKTAKVTFGSAAGEDVSALAEPAWTTWNIPLSSFSGITLAKVKSMAIGFGSGSGTGKVYIDDICLYPTVTTTVTTPTLVGWWKLDNDVKDSSGKGNNGTITGTPTYVAAGKIGAALTLNGTTDWVDCGADTSLNITDKVTLSAWIKPTSFANSAYQTVVSKGDHAYCLQQTTGNLIEFYVYDGAWYAATSAAVLSTFNGSWHHVAGTYDGTQLKLYVDGALIAGTLHTGDIDTATHSVSIGRNSEQTGRIYAGVIDDVRIYQGNLPTSEIKKLANP